MRRLGLLFAAMSFIVVIFAPIVPVSAASDWDGVPEQNVSNVYLRHNTATQTACSLTTSEDMSLTWPSVVNAWATPGVSGTTADEDWLAAVSGGGWWGVWQQDEDTDALIDGAQELTVMWSNSTLVLDALIDTAPTPDAYYFGKAAGSFSTIWSATIRYQRSHNGTGACDDKTVVGVSSHSSGVPFTALVDENGVPSRSKNYLLSGNISVDYPAGYEGIGYNQAGNSDAIYSPKVDVTVSNGSDLTYSMAAAPIPELKQCFSAGARLWQFDDPEHTEGYVEIMLDDNGTPVGEVPGQYSPLVIGKYYVLNVATEFIYKLPLLTGGLPGDEKCNQAYLDEHYPEAVFADTAVYFEADGSDFSLRSDDLDCSYISVGVGVGDQGYACNVEAVVEDCEDISLFNFEAFTCYMSAFFKEAGAAIGRLFIPRSSVISGHFGALKNKADEKLGFVSESLAMVFGVFDSLADGVTSPSPDLSFPGTFFGETFGFSVDVINDINPTLHTWLLTTIRVLTIAALVFAAFRLYYHFWGEGKH